MSQMVDLAQPLTQERFGALVGITQEAVSDLVKRGVLLAGQPAGTWLLAYCSKIRQEAAGRSVELTEQRARYDRARADFQEMVNDERRRALVPTALLERILAMVGRRVAAILEAVPARVRRECAGVDAATLAVIEQEIARARNEAALLELPLDQIDGSVGDQAGDSQRVERAAGADAAAAVAVG